MVVAGDGLSEMGQMDFESEGHSVFRVRGRRTAWHTEFFLGCRAFIADPTGSRSLDRLSIRKQSMLERSLSNDSGRVAGRVPPSIPYTFRFVRQIFAIIEG